MSDSTPPEQSPETVVDRLTRALAHAILRGEHVPGSKLSTVRALAAEHGVTVPTIQRVLAQLEALGLVSARQGSGTRVNDPHADGSLALFPYWIDAYRGEPQQAAALLADVLALRRDVAVTLLPRVRERLTGPRSTAATSSGPEPLAALVHHLVALERAIAARPRDVHAIARADYALMRALLALAGTRAHLALLHSVGRVLMQTALLPEAMYGRPQDNVAAHREVIAALPHASDAELAKLVGAHLERLDARTVRRFTRLLAK